MRNNLSLAEIIGFALSMTIVVVAGRAYATLLYDNGSPNGSNGSEMTMWIQAEDFALASPATITDVRFWTIEQPSQPGYNGSIVWTLYSDAGGSPGGILDRGTALATQVSTGSIFGFEGFQNDFSLGPLALDAGTYWLGLHNGPLTHDSRDYFYWQNSDPFSGNGHEDRTPFDSGGWSINGEEHAFELFGTTTTIPEPSTGLLVIAGVLGLAGRRRMRA